VSSCTWQVETCKDTVKILILDAGGTGGYFGGRLHQAGADVTFLVRPARAQHIATHGLMLESPKDKTTLQVKTVLAGHVKPEYDVVILACKAYDLASSIAAITPALGAQTCVLPLLNGISHIDTLDAAFGQQRVMGGACQIAATLTPEGVVKALMEFQSIVWGARHPAQAALAQAMGQSFANTGVGWRVSGEIMLDMWEECGPHAPPLRGSLPPERAHFCLGRPGAKTNPHAGGHDLPDARIGGRHFGRARRRRGDDALPGRVHRRRDERGLRPARPGHRTLSRHAVSARLDAHRLDAARPGKRRPHRSRPHRGFHAGEGAGAWGG
jgi:predicted dinucleotide-binding enzyme